MSDILNLNLTNYDSEISRTRQLTRATRFFLTQAIRAHLEHKPSPTIAASQFNRIVTQVSEIMLGQEKLFVVLSAWESFHRFHLTSEKSPHWDDFYTLQGRARPENNREFDEGFPRVDNKATYEIITWDGDHFRAQVDRSGQYTADGTVWVTFSNLYFHKWQVVAWIKL